MENVKIDSLKAKLVKIWNDKNISINFSSPNITNPNANSFHKIWVSTINVEIFDMEKLVKSCNNDELYLGRILKIFYDGIIDIFKYYGIKLFHFYWGGVVAVIDSPSKNCENAQRILNAAYDINGFLGQFWKMSDYKIFLNSAIELFFSVDGQKLILDMGGAVYSTKKLTDKVTKNNCIVFSESFVKNNDDLLFDYGTKKNIYRIETVIENNLFSTRKEYFTTLFFSHWKPS